MAKEVKLALQRVLGAASVFRQGGSLRLILPKKSYAYLKIPRDTDDNEYSTVILIATDKGILMRSLTDYLGDDDMKET